ncbi:MAG: NAD-dependent epimerase/dehydratase family protein [Patescibacteria group bacterium]
MKILVTGVAGAIGSHVAERLAQMGHDVVGVDSLTDYYHRAIKETNLSDVRESGVKVFLSDLSVDDISETMPDIEVIYHFAAQPGISASTGFDLYIKNNIIATHRLLEKAMELSALKVFVHISTSSVYGARAQGDETTEPKPTSYYGVTKLAAEQLAMSYHRELNLPVTVLRLFSVYGERERPEKLYHKLIKSILEEKTFPLHEGSEHHIRSYTHIEDIVDACVLVLDNFDKAIGEIFNIGNDKTITTGEGISVLEEILGKKANLVIMPRRTGDQTETAANIKKAREIFGYNPKINISEGLSRQVKWHKDKLHNKIEY